VPVWRRALLGNTVKSLAPGLNSITCTVGSPAYICALLKAQTLKPWKLPPAGKPNMFADM
jgi:hypothetical protein